MNGELVRRATGNQPGSMLAPRGERPEAAITREKIRYLYLAALSRLPTRQELNDQQRAAGGPQRQRRRGAAGYLVGAAEYERVYSESLEALAVSHLGTLDHESQRRLALHFVVSMSYMAKANSFGDSYGLLLHSRRHVASAFHASLGRGVGVCDAGVCAHAHAAGECRSR